MQFMTTEKPKRHLCGQQGWAYCCVCDGRIHERGCTSRMNRMKDCCAARHKMLYDQGQTRGIGDESQAMWSEKNPMGYHDPWRDGRLDT
jgi:hypothetical protein